VSATTTTQREEDLVVNRRDNKAAAVETESAAPGLILPLNRSIATAF
jgi:hypothetical protein